MRGRLHRRASLAARAAVAAVMLSAVVPAPADADVWCWLFGSGCAGGGSTASRAPAERGAPEVDPSAVVNLIALLAGGAATLGGRLRRR